MKEIVSEAEDFVDFTLIPAPEIYKKRLLGGCRSTVQEGIRRGVVTPFVRLGPRARALPRRESAILNQARAAGLGDAELKAIVTRLMNEREALGRRLRTHIVSTASQASA